MRLHKSILGCCIRIAFLAPFCHDEYLGRRPSHRAVGQTLLKELAHLPQFTFVEMLGQMVGVRVPLLAAGIEPMCEMARLDVPLRLDCFHLHLYRSKARSREHLFEIRSIPVDSRVVGRGVDGLFGGDEALA